MHDVFKASNSLADRIMDCKNEINSSKTDSHGFDADEFLLELTQH